MISLYHGRCATPRQLNKYHLKGKYLGILLSATATDANGSLFPLAYAIVAVENDNNWFWFATILHDVIHMHSPAFLVPRGLVFISDRQKGLLEAIELLFPSSPNGYCLRHLYENMHKKYKNPQLRERLYDAARAVTDSSSTDRLVRQTSSPQYKCGGNLGLQCCCTNQTHFDHSCKEIPS